LCGGTGGYEGQEGFASKRPEHIATRFSRCPVEIMERYFDIASKGMEGLLEGLRPETRQVFEMVREAGSHDE
jgi:hypothetical protein